MWRPPEVDKSFPPTLELPQGEITPWRIDQPYFMATAFRKTKVGGQPALMSQCFEYENGKWEGFVSIRFEEESNEQQD